MSSSIRHVVSTALAISAITGLAARDRAEIYATVIDAVQAPVSGLGTADFVLRDGGTRIGVLSAVPATDPLSVAIVVSGLDESDWPAARRAIEELVRTLGERSPGSRVGFMPRDVAPGARVVMLPDTSSVSPALSHGAGGPQSAIDSLVVACAALRDAPADRRTILAIIKRHPTDGGTDPPGRLLEAVIGSRAALWTIEIGPAAGSATALDESLAEGVKAGGALRERVGLAADVPGATARVVNRWLSQYLVTYTWPEPMVSQFSLVTRHDSGEVLTPSWTR